LHSIKKERNLRTSKIKTQTTLFLIGIQKYTPPPVSNCQYLFLSFFLFVSFLYQIIAQAFTCAKGKKLRQD